MPALIIVLIMGGIYGLLYYLNSKAPIPEGAKAKLENCAGCSIESCELHPTHRDEDE